MAALLFDCTIDPALVAGLDPIWASGRLAAGPAVPELESRISALVGGRPVVATSDMTQALATALRLAGAGPGDEVVTQALNCMSSNSAITMIGATPVWVDVDPDTASVDLDDLRACIGPRTRAVVIYHVAGYVGDLPALRRICDDAGVPLIEDGNNALGASAGNSPVGSVGDFAIFSFYANRQINAVEGGALVCRDEAAAAHARRLRRFGIEMASFRGPDGEIDPHADIPEIGYSASMSNLNAALACLQFECLSDRIERNRANAAYLGAALSGRPDLSFVREHAGTRGVFWVALVRSARRDALLADLKTRGVHASRLHQRNDVYSGFGARRRDLPGTTTLEHEMMALPCGWWLSPGDLDTIVEAVRSAT